MGTIALPDSTYATAEEMAAQTGFDSAAEYIADLIRRDVEQTRQQPDNYVPLFGDYIISRPLTEAERERQKRAIEKLLIEGLDSGPATEMTPEDWKDLRRRVHERREMRERGQG